MKATQPHQASFARKLLWVLVIGVLFLLPIWGRCLYEARQGLLLGLEAQQAGDTQQAIRSFAQAVRWRSVGNPFAVGAQRALLEMEMKLSGGDLVLLLKESRRALFLSRSIYFESETEWLLIERIDQKLRELGVRVPVEMITSKPLRPSFSWQFAAQLGFWGWVILTLTTIRWGFSARGDLRLGGLFLGGSGSLAFFLFWLYALSLA